jgi:hypothetical protein
MNGYVISAAHHSAMNEHVILAAHPMERKKDPEGYSGPFIMWAKTQTKGGPLFSPPTY